MKKKWLVLLSIGLCINLIGCSNTNNSTTNTTEISNANISTNTDIIETTTEEPKIDITYNSSKINVSSVKNLIATIINNDVIYDYLIDDTHKTLVFIDNTVNVYNNDYSEIISDEISELLINKLKNNSEFNTLSIPMYVSFTEDGNISRIETKLNDNFIVCYNNGDYVSEDVFNQQIDGKSYNDIVDENSLIGTYVAYKLENMLVRDWVKENYSMADIDNINPEDFGCIKLNESNNIEVSALGMYMNGTYIIDGNNITLTAEDVSETYIYDKEQETLTDINNNVYKKTSNEAIFHDNTDISIKEQVLVDENNIKITATDLKKSNNRYKLLLNIENNTDTNIYVQPKDAIINDYMVYCYGGTKVISKKKANLSIELELEDNDITTIQQLELSLSILDDESYNSILTTDLINIEVN